MRVGDTITLYRPKIEIVLPDYTQCGSLQAAQDFADEFSLGNTVDEYYRPRKKFKTLTEEVFRHPGSAVYACDKIRDKYNEHFKLNGETIYFNSSLKRKAYSPINLKSPNIAYFGNVRLGRNRSLCELADALKRINSNYILQVYTNEVDEDYISMLKKHSNILFGGAIPYEQVQKKIAECDIYVVVESFLEENVNFTKYSLSTKAADGLTSGSTVFAYGPIESGVIDYLVKSHAAAVCTEENKLYDVLSELLDDQNYQEDLYNRSLIVSKDNHTVEGSSRTFHKVISGLFE